MRATLIIAMVLVIGALIWILRDEQTIPGPVPEEYLQRAVQSHGFNLTFEGVASLPATGQAYESKAQELGFAASCIDVYLLSEDQQDQMLEYIASYLKTTSGNNRELFFDRLETWAEVRQQLGAMEGYSTETLFAALYNMPLTTHVFDTILERRGYERQTVDPSAVAQTMASAEIHETACAVATVISAKSKGEQARFFQELGEVVARLGPNAP